MREDNRVLEVAEEIGLLTKETLARFNFESLDREEVSIEEAYSDIDDEYNNYISQSWLEGFDSV